MTAKLYDPKNRNVQEFEDLRFMHLSAMTGEQLHSKADIATELAYRDHLRLCAVGPADKWVYISGMDEMHGPMSDAHARDMANDHNRLVLEINADKLTKDCVWTIAIVIDNPEYNPPWAFTAEHPAAQKISTEELAKMNTRAVDAGDG